MSSHAVEFAFAVTYQNLEKDVQEDVEHDRYTILCDLNEEEGSVEFD